MTSTATVIRVLGTKQTSPGPGSYDIPSCFGKAPSWTIKHKYTKKQAESTGGYEVLPSSIGESPKWSLRSRQKTRDFVAAPGPNYVPPPFGKDAHSSALHQRPREPKDMKVSPGPGKYDTRPGTSGPRYSVKGRQFPPDEGKIEGPGPGKYLPDFTKVMDSSQKCGIGVRLEDPKRATTPGPADYSIKDTSIKHTTCFHSRHYKPPPSSTPGPKYDQPTDFGVDSPKYSLRSRIDSPKRPLTAPYQKLPECFGDGVPKWTLSSRHKDRDVTASPGPDYVPPAFGNDGRKYSLVSRRERKRDVKGESPGPAAYSPKYMDTSHKFTMKARQFPPDDGKVDGPGGGKYLPDFDNVLPSSPKLTIKNRFDEKKKEQGPGYEDLGSTLKHKGGITIGNREELTITPGLT